MTPWRSVAECGFSIRQFDNANSRHTNALSGTVECVYLSPLPHPNMYDLIFLNETKTSYSINLVTVDLFFKFRFTPCEFESSDSNSNSDAPLAVCFKRQLIYFSHNVTL